MIIYSVRIASAGGGWPALPHRAGVRGFETAARGRDKALLRWFESVAGMTVNAAGGQLAGGDAGAADLARRCAEVVLEGVQRKRSLRRDEQHGEKKAG